MDTDEEDDGVHLSIEYWIGLKLIDMNV